MRSEGAWLEPRFSKPLCLLLYLAYLGEWVGREQLAFLFWPDSEEKSARRNLRQLILRARDLPYAGGLEIESDRLRWVITSDVAEFRRALAKQEWSAATALYSGDLLAELTAYDSEAYGTWLELERQVLRGAWQQAALQRAEELEHRAHHQEAAALLQRLLEGDELAEDILQRYLRASYLAGQRDAALKTFRVFEQRLHEELDLAPLDSTLELVEAIRDAVPLSLEEEPEVPEAAVPLSVLRPPRLVGREEVARRVRRARTPVLVIAGEAGMGKSRLLEELAPHAYQLACHEGLQQVPFYPITEAIRRDLRAGRSLPALGHYLQDLTRLLPEAAPEVRPEPLEAGMARARLLEALTIYLEASVPKGTELPLIIDDLQWADDATLDFLLYLVNRGTLRILGAYRIHEVAPNWAFLRGLRSRQTVTEIRLEPLDEKAVQELMAVLTGQPEGPPIFSRWLHRHTGGNPMFLLEILKALFETGTLSTTESGWQSSIDDITRDYSELEVPDAITQVIERRLAKLPQPALRVLKTASVIGSHFDPPLLAHVSGLSEAAVLEALEETEHAGLTLGEDFSHDLLRQCIYTSLTPSQRRTLHARVAESLPPSTDPSVRAEHWLAAREMGRAATLWSEAAADFQKQGLFDPAILLLERAVAQVPAGSQRAALQATLAIALQQAGRNSEALARVQLLLADTDDPGLRASALNTRAVIYLREGRVEVAREAVNACLELADEATDETFQRSFLLTRVILHHSLGKFDEAIALLEPELADLRTRPFTDDICTVLSSLAAAYDMKGDHLKALPLHREALRVATTHGYRYFQVDAALNLLYCLMDLGRPEEALAEAEQTLKVGRFENTPTLRTNLATAYFELGRYREALAHYRQVTRESEHDHLLAIAWARLAETHARLGEQGAAATAIDEAVTQAQQTEYRLARARVLITALKLGNAEQVAQVEPWLEGLGREALPGYLLEELEEVLAVRSER